MDWVACLVLEDVLDVCLKFRPVNNPAAVVLGDPGEAASGLMPKSVIVIPAINIRS